MIPDPEKVYDLVLRILPSFHPFNNSDLEIARENHLVREKRISVIDIAIEQAYQAGYDDGVEDTNQTITLEAANDQ